MNLRRVYRFICGRAHRRSNRDVAATLSRACQPTPRRAVTLPCRSRAAKNRSRPRISPRPRTCPPTASPRGVDGEEALGLFGDERGVREGLVADVAPADAALGVDQERAVERGLLEVVVAVVLAEQ